MKLGDLIKDFRRSNHLSMQDFANMAGLSKGYVSMLEKNQHPQSQRKLSPSVTTYQKVATAMSMSLDDLISVLDGDEPVRLVQPSNNLTGSESRLLDSFRVLNQDGQDKVMEYADDLASSERYTVSDNVVTYKTPILNAAHERTDIEVTDEMRQHDEDIMDDENF